MGEEEAGHKQERGVDFSSPCADVGRGRLGMRGDCVDAVAVGEGRSWARCAVGGGWAGAR
jgi:hypothetical protein